jgi:2,4-diaminopentanoate dehydrogenase
MDRKIRAVIWGLGNLGKITARFMLEAGVNIVGAIGRESNLGKDVGEVLGLVSPLKVVVRSDSDAVLAETKPDIVVICFGHLLADIAPAIRKSVEHGANVIGIPDGAFYPWNEAPDLASELDKLAKANGVTVSASGFQDVIWSSLPAHLTGASHDIKAIELESYTVLDVAGPELFKIIPLGKTVEEFRSEKDKVGGMSRPFAIAIESLLADLRLNIANVVQSSEPLVAREDYLVKSVGVTIKKGNVIGFVNSIETDTKEGVTIRGTLHAQFDQDGWQEKNIWRVKGVPELYMEVRTSSAALVICLGLVNRIPDVINSPPGYVCAVQMPKLIGRIKPMHMYVNA